MTQKELAALARGMGTATKEAIAAATEPLRERILALEAKLTALEARPALKWTGIWNDSQIYQHGNIVTWGGSMWHCNELHSGARPGESNVWTLIVKKGRDGRDRGRDDTTR